jgi:hypothetical protein
MAKIAKRTEQEIQQILDSKRKINLPPFTPNYYQLMAAF